MESEAVAVQFLHPLPQHGPDKGDRSMRSWNRGRRHARKFMRGTGAVIESVGASPRPADFTFWGEWEPPSRVSKLDGVGERNPQWLHEPYIDWDESPDLQNTDPFVFGPRFRYTLCQQIDKLGRVKVLRHLPPGSVVLFGSCSRRQFLLDTVFVTGDEFIDWTDKTRPTSVHGDDEGVFQHATLDRIGGTPSIGLRLYSAAMYSERERFGDLFSFVPCSVSADGRASFARPVIELPNISAQNTGHKCLAHTTADTVRLWNDVVETVLGNEQSLSLAVRIDPPSWNRDPRHVGRPVSTSSSRCS